MVVATVTAQPEAPPTRIVSLVPAATEILFAVGAGPSVVGVSSFDREPAAVRDLPRVGALLDPDLERILSLRPDLVVVYATQHDLHRQLARAGIDSYRYEHAGLTDVLDTIRQLADRTGHAENGADVAGAIARALADIRARVAGRPRPRTLIVIAREPGTLRNLFASGGIGFLHDMVAVAGGDNVLADFQRQSVQATTEMVLARRPDVILELRAQLEPSPDVAAWQALPALPAVRHARVIALQGSDLVVPGPRIGRGTERIARALHPEAFR
jgi:iron complex transport system substrate-binding protein